MTESQTVSRATDFPVEWANPEEARLFWTREMMHFPEPIGPLTETFEVAALGDGMERALVDYSLPIAMPHRVLNGYVYSAAAPRSTDPGVLADLGHQAEGKMRTGAQTFESDWKETYLPELERDVAAHRAFDYDSASDADLARHVAWTIDRRFRHYHIHFSALAPGFPVSTLFIDTYTQLTGSTDEMEPHVLLQGLQNKTVEGGHALWRLSRLAKKSASVRQAIDEAPPEQLFQRLEQSPEGREFASAFRAFLDEFGWRGDSWNMDDRTWVSYPKTPQYTLRAYLLQPDEASPELAHARLAAERERALAAVRERLSGAPVEERAQFEGLLRAMQFANQVQEDHNYIIDQKLQHLSRRAFVEAGKMMVARGQIEDAEDVLFLTTDELRSQADRAGAEDLRPVIVRRRADRARQAAMTPPPAIGTPPPPPPPGYVPSPFEVAMMRFFGAPPQASSATEIRGNAGSRGKVSGIARVAMTLADATGLQPGEILVCPTTAPPWTPLFATAAAVVTDTGGILSHCAIVAREFGIPAVVGTGVGTQRIRTGQRVTVDGSAGTVTLG